MAYWTL